MGLILEKKILNLSVEMWTLFLKLKSQHPDEAKDFADGIHRCQYLIGMRIARKYEPKIFPIKCKKIK